MNHLRYFLRATGFPIPEKLAGKLRPLQSSTFQDGLFVEFVAEACILLIKNEMKLFLANFVRSLSHVPLRYACLTTAVKITRILNRIQEARRKIGNNMPLYPVINSDIPANTKSAAAAANITIEDKLNPRLIM